MQLSNKLRALIFKSAVWGVPIGIFFTWNELPQHQVGVMLDALKSGGATLMNNTQLVIYLLGANKTQGPRITQTQPRGIWWTCGRDGLRRWWTTGRRWERNTNTTCWELTKRSLGRWEIGATVLVPEYAGKVTVKP